MKVTRIQVFLFLLIFVVSSILVVGCSGSQPTAKPEAKPSAEQGKTAEKPAEPEKPAVKYNGIDKISIGASGVGSASYNKLTVWSTFISNKLGINITPEGTAGSVANAQLVQTGDVEVGATTPNIAREGLEGKGTFEGKTLDKLSLVMTLDNFVLQFYSPEEKGIKSIYDLNGKHVNLSKAGSGTDTWGRRLFEEFGIKPSKISNVSPSDGNDLMRDGVIDAAGVMGSIHPSIVEMNTTKKLNIFGLSSEDADKFIAKWADVNKVTMKENTYEGQSQPFITVGEVSILAASKDLPEDMVYDMVKFTYEGKDELSKGYEGFKSIYPEDIAAGLIPLHPGAYKYFQEKGVNIPDTMKP